MLHRSRLLLAVAVTSVVALLATAAPAQAAPVTITNATQFTDTDGNVVHAHGGGVIKVGDFYYFFGENRNADNTFEAVSAYRSTDLKTWEFRNHVLTAASDPELQNAKIERPKVIFNSTTGQFVMWMHKENGSDYSEARAAVAVSDTIDGDYAWQGSFRPPSGTTSRDQTVFVDDDGTAYQITSTDGNADLSIFRLTADYTTYDSLVANPWDGQYREAPALFKRNGVYFMVTSGNSGWSPNQQKYATATNIAGPWSAMQDIGDSTGYGSQTTFVLEVAGSEGTSYMYMGDRWGNSMGGTVDDSEYVWLPLDFNSDTSMTMSWYSEITIDTDAGSVTGVEGDYSNLIARHSGKCADVVSASTANGAEIAQWECHGGTNQQWDLQDLGNGYVQIVAAHSGKCLDVANDSTANGAKVIQYTCGNGDNQQWQVQDAPDGHVRLAARHSGKCLDVTKESTADGARLQQWDCHSGNNQQWQIAAA
ncbi:RICIN domain-containing protein [Glycomyces sp. L485]|uniref:RICIN domain-containing protein n=1 Tax=Glycomyces sp. L485 TaxID=2909235 RepID=UPI001F4AF4DA|nr:RICIN domain-containing protein [Glycomyces sp. L485]MCH7230548.1 RICIN domain-containing protein [Glycomyces sp. L485]